MRPLIPLFFSLAALGACGGGTKAYIPVDSPLRTWEAPEADAYAEEPQATQPAQPAHAAQPAKEAKKPEKKQ